MLDFYIRIALYLIPLYFANMTPTIFPGKQPLDFNRKFFDGRAIFGEGKTLKGTVAGIIAGVLVSVFVYLIASDITLFLTPDYILLGFLLSVGAIGGDVAGSFLKRRAGIERGNSVFLLDQLDFIIGGVILGSVLYLPQMSELAVIVVATVILHRVTNFFAYKLKIKKVPW